MEQNFSFYVLAKGQFEVIIIVNPLSIDTSHEKV